jgi:CubicO group peptidase (beta-lactamase class C family)
VTIRHLLTHTSGIVDLPPQAIPPRRVRLDLARDFHDTVLARARADSLHFTPGTSWQYSNAGYQLLGRIIERATGQSYAAYVAEHLLAPLGLAHTSYCERHASHDARYATGHTTDSTGHVVVVGDIDMEGPYAAGSLCSTARDLVTWTAGLQHGRVVQNTSYAQMIEPRRFALERPQYGFGLQLEELAGHRIVAHDGSINGFSSRAASYPADSLIVVVLVNSDRFAAGPFERRIAAFVLGLPDQAPRDLSISVDDARRIVGRYRAREFGFTLTVSVQDGRVWGEVGGIGRFRLRRQGDIEFASDEDHWLRFRFVGEGSHVERVEMSEPGHAATLDRLP